MYLIICLETIKNAKLQITKIQENNMVVPNFKME